MAQTTLKENAEQAKCEGLGCAFKQSCGRYLRPEAENQSWASYYAMADVDCDAYEAVVIEDKK